ncbi:hypothetical protein Clacol_002892 [Clathrus columnatus]|uniref:Uncharacterized protein n=1 Tax=Clathrus columnatus TaxID=1419009 RepID=A0AAV5A5D0_9AGAM|nr:hypothetical protein Clacol_002892 [Clathrus columnatus]
MQSSQEQKYVQDVEKKRASDSLSISDSNVDWNDREFINKTIRKVDFRLLPILGSIYAFSLIDRNNLSNARISGADVEIGLGVGNHYSLATLVFFIPYIILEVPSNMLFRRIGASAFLGTIGLLWGVIMISMGFVKTWNQMAALRGLLGILEQHCSVIVDFPDKNKFLTYGQTQLIRERVERDRADTEHDTLTIQKCLRYACDLKLYTPVPGFSMGYLCTTLSALMAIVGLSMTAFHPRNAVRFAGCFIGLAGSQGNIPSLLAYQSNNIRRQSKRAFASALQVGFGGIGGIMASLAYRQQDSPRYRLGITITIAFQGLLIVLVILNSIWFMYRNNQVKKGGKPIEGYPGFLYTL